MNALPHVLQQQGQCREAALLYRRAVAIYRESLGERHRFTEVALCNLAPLRYLKGELDAADTQFRERLSILEEVHPEDHQELAHNRSRLGAVL